MNQDELDVVSTLSFCEYTCTTRAQHFLGHFFVPKFTDEIGDETILKFGFSLLDIQVSCFEKTGQQPRLWKSTKSGMLNV